ncbi:MAG: FG-GAP-like repeat-containing protein [Bacteroidia bacterium]
MKTKLLYISVALTLTINVFAQNFTAAYTFDNVTTSSGLIDPTAVPTATGVLFGNFFAVGTASNPNAGGRFAFTNWPLGATNGNDNYSSFTGNINTSEYYEVTISTLNGFSVTLTDIIFTVQRSGTGCRNYSVRSSIDNYATNLPASISPSNANLSAQSGNVFFWNFDAITLGQNGSTITLSGGNYTNLTSPITFRFYGWNAEGAGGSFSIDNVIFSGSTAISSISPICFNPATNLVTSGNHTSSVASADFNGDGNKDLVATNQNSNNVAILLGTGTGSFGTATTFNVGTQPSFVISTDFNGDGVADIATSNQISNNVSVLLGTGNGSFGAATNFAAGNYANTIATADFNGDGNADIVTTNNGTNTVSVLLGTGTGSFGAATNIIVGSNPGQVICSDLNGDSNIDLAVSSGSGNIYILLGTGTGSFGASTGYSAGATSYSITSGDFNGDGNIDLATANQTLNNVSIFLGTGTGSFGTATNFATAAAPNMVISADFNGDGVLDLAMANSTANVVSVLQGLGSGNFTTATTFSASTYPYYLNANDFNNDGKMDLVSANTNSNDVSLLLNNQTSQPPTPTGTTQFCINPLNSTYTTIGATDAVSYTWEVLPSGAGIIIGTGTIATVDWDSSYTGTATIKVKGINSNGCEGAFSNTLSVSINPLPIVTLSAFSSVCSDTSAFILTGGTPTGGLYSGASVASNIFNPSISGAGTFPITYVYTDGNSCVDSATQNITVNVCNDSSECFTTTDGIDGSDWSYKDYVIPTGYRLDSVLMAATRPGYSTSNHDFVLESCQGTTTYNHSLGTYPIDYTAETNSLYNVWIDLTSFNYTSVGMVRVSLPTNAGAIWNQVCFATSPTISTGVNTNEIEPNVSFFPNPTSGLVSITGITNETIVVANSIGQIIIQSQKVNTIDLSSYDKGIYFIQIINEKGIIINSSKIVTE